MTRFFYQNSIISRFYVQPSFFKFSTPFIQPWHSFFNFNIRFIQAQRSLLKLDICFIQTWRFCHLFFKTTDVEVEKRMSMLNKRSTEFVKNEGRM